MIWSHIKKKTTGKKWTKSSKLYKPTFTQTSRKLGPSSIPKLTLPTTKSSSLLMMTELSRSTNWSTSRATSSKSRRPCSSWSLKSRKSFWWSQRTKKMKKTPCWPKSQSSASLAIKTWTNSRVTHPDWKATGTTCRIRNTCLKPWAGSVWQASGR